jgi:hypothetical protein
MRKQSRTRHPDGPWLLICFGCFQNFAGQGIDILTPVPKNLHAVMAVENGPIWPRFQTVRLTWSKGLLD